MTESMVIGIAGGSGSGKTTLMRALIDKFGDNIAVISHDNYYKAHDDMPMEDRARLNYDEPAAFDTDMLIEHLRLLKQGRTIHCPVYDFSVHNRTKETTEIRPRKVIIVEGILIFENRELFKEMDIKIFVDTDADVRLARRIHPDVRKRGCSLESVLGQINGVHLQSLWTYSVDLGKNPDGDSLLNEAYREYLGGLISLEELIDTLIPRLELYLDE